MYMKSPFHITILFVFISTVLYSQLNPVPPINMSNVNLNPELVKSYIDNVRNNTLNYSSVSNKRTDVIGSPYLDEKFRKVTVNDSPFHFMLRYNAYSDKLEFEKDNQVYDLDSPNNLIFKFPETNNRIQKLNYSVNGKTTDGYLFLLRLGEKYILYKKENVLLKYDEGANNSYVDHSKIRFNKTKPDYILFYNNEFKSLPKNKKEFVKLFKHDDELGEFMKNSRNNLINDNDFIKAIEYLDKR